ncbi:hypothetical protein H4R18_005804 [Coemansia javaensis]|uniref:Uncharacterized protein n=1 Tax=Coemansia javaensis TaxID=2761396 RepID=A0A9W8LCR4_9FUNG|nr:hypothetical protein H4R18_005804 [Coemansia javaensis]
MPSSPAPGLRLRRPDEPAPEKAAAAARRHDLGLRRAKTATANSIKKLFKGRRDTAAASASAAAAPASQPPDADADALPPPVAPYARNRPIESRPSSVHSSKSVRSIFSDCLAASDCPPTSACSSADAAADDYSDNDNSCPSAATDNFLLPASGLPSLANYRIAAPADRIPAFDGRVSASDDRVSASDDCTSPASSGPPPPAANPQRRHTSLAAPPPPPPPPPAHQTPQLQPQVLPQVLAPLLMARPSMASVQPLLSVPHTPPASCSSGTAKSPAAYSSRSLGLSSLDFGYDRKIAAGLLSRSPGSSPAASSLSDMISYQSESSRPATPSPYSMGIVIAPAAAAAARSSPPVAVADDPIEAYVPTNCSIYTPADDGPVPPDSAVYCDFVDPPPAPIDLVDISLLSGPGPAGAASPLPIPARTNDYGWALHIPPASACTADSGLVSVGESPEEPLVEPIEELLVEPTEEPLDEPRDKESSILETADAAAAAVVRQLGAVDAVCDCALAATTPAATRPKSQYVVEDIDELLAELGLADPVAAKSPLAGRSDADGTSLPMQHPAALDDDNDAFSLREIDELLEQLDENAGLVAKRGCSPTPLRDQGAAASAPPALDPAAVVAILGSPERVVSAGTAAACRVDSAGLIRSLGPVLDATLLIPARPLDVGQLVRRLGRADGISGALLGGAPRRPEGRRLDVPDLIAGLGGAYTPEFIVCNVECVRWTSEQTLAGDAAAARGFPRLCCAAKAHACALDVDEEVGQGARSRATSVVSYDQPFESVQGISKLMAALRIRPFVVSRPFLGPSRTVLFPHLC